MVSSKNRLYKIGLISAVFLISIFFIAIEVNPSTFAVVYQVSPNKMKMPAESSITVPKHADTPFPVKAVYMTECVAADSGLRNKLVDLIKRTELNSIVIDLKDYSGKISFNSDNPELKNKTARTCVVVDMVRFIESMHEKGIYVIGRITVFQDPVFASDYPDLAVKTGSDREVIWKDKKGVSYVDPGAKEMWDYVIEMAREAHDVLGFDEINFDYIRFPSDGNMSDVYYPISQDVLDKDPSGGRASVMKEFFEYLSKEMRKNHITISADLFGMSTTNHDDLKIGQILEDVIPNFDYVAPMVYPSHYPPGFIGLPDPAAEPYKVIKYSIDEALKRASTTPFKFRPWLQDFDLGFDYNAEMIRQEKQAVYDTGLQSWMMWNAANVYTEAALDPKEE